MWVFDATPLIYLGKVSQLSLVEQVAEPCVLPERVYEEVVTTGLEAGYMLNRRNTTSFTAWIRAVTC
ncbi:unknown [Haloarcula marismortui ATCC 43049]|uniref:Uncharacterized protein n=1 Tax=Haloarcula marismortui (strain ATCC 43049 / DSM 3752 / JCM 8966 / VKM B-1809) TaxID=272569 RepID=Q5V1W8_HALMA|nr:hypothetical protein [Haloarcula marismortui]AAV46484.1 unknown [Haloarcula marismortui ATCC 43049]QCP91205.1 hypothetical protein E6P14_10180 [Haloarcula marismortui ATCC 43049]